MLENSFAKYPTALEKMSPRCEFHTTERLQLMHTLIDITCDIWFIWPLLHHLRSCKSVHTYFKRKLFIIRFRKNQLSPWAPQLEADATLGTSQKRDKHRKVCWGTKTTVQYTWYKKKSESHTMQKQKYSKCCNLELLHKKNVRKYDTY